MPRGKQTEPPREAKRARTEALAERRHTVYVYVKERKNPDKPLCRYADSFSLNPSLYRGNTPLYSRAALSYITEFTGREALAITVRMTKRHSYCEYNAHEAIIASRSRRAGKDNSRNFATLTETLSAVFESTTTQAVFVDCTIVDGLIDAVNSIRNKEQLVLWIRFDKHATEEGLKDILRAVKPGNGLTKLAVDIDIDDITNQEISGVPGVGGPRNEVEIFQGYKHLFKPGDFASITEFQLNCDRVYMHSTAHLRKLPGFVHHIIMQALNPERIKAIKLDGMFTEEPTAQMMEIIRDMPARFRNIQDFEIDTTAFRNESLRAFWTSIPQYRNIKTLRIRQNCYSSHQQTGHANLLAMTTMELDALRDIHVVCDNADYSDTFERVLTEASIKRSFALHKAHFNNERLFRVEWPRILLFVVMALMDRGATVPLPVEIVRLIVKNIRF